jgi:hypothetical protein
VAGVEPDTLVRLARADHFGGSGGVGSGDAAGFPNEALFVARLRAADADAVSHTDVVTGRHAIARGFTAGPELGELLARCREIQLETGSSDPDAILDEALALRSTSGGGS